jgi:hypothetical protein
VVFATRRQLRQCFLELAMSMSEERCEETPRRSEASMPIAPISWGELIDKITILEIKSVKIASESARANVVKELRLLQNIAGTIACSEISSLQTELKAINSALWTIEDVIREKDRRKEFDEAFIELARSVYNCNDQRALIKRKINEILRSEIFEEKSYGNDGAIIPFVPFTGGHQR